MTLRCALYARYSSDQQRAASIEDQFRICRERADREGWKIAGTYKDGAISGASVILRPGVQALLEDAGQDAFDVVLAEALDRVSRDQADVAVLYKHLRFAGVPIVTLAEGEIDELHVGLKGTMNALFLKDLAAKTHRGQRGRVEQGKAGGSLGYGYDVVKAVDAAGEPVRGERRINEAEAAIVRRIFREYAAGASPRAIVRRLNDDGIPGPRGKRWGDNTLRGHAKRGTGILNNELYVGRLVWNRQRRVMDPKTGRKVSRINPPEDWVTVDVPDLRIVVDELWQAAKDRQAESAEQYAAVIEGVRAARANPLNAAHRPHHLLSGLLQCGVCGGAYVKRGQDRYACSNHARTDGCTNRRSIRRAVLEERVLAGLKDRLMAPEAAAEAIRAYAEETNRLNRERRASGASDRRELAEIKKKIAAMIAAIEDGGYVRGMSDRLRELEARQDELAERLSAAPADLPDIHPNVAEIYRRKVARLAEAVNRPEDRDEAASAIRGLIERIVIAPGEKWGEVHATLHGDLATILEWTAKGDGKNRGGTSPPGLSVSAETGTRFGVDFAQSRSGGAGDSGAPFRCRASRPAIRPHRGDDLARPIEERRGAGSPARHRRRERGRDRLARLHPRRGRGLVRGAARRVPAPPRRARAQGGLGAGQGARAGAAAPDPVPARREEPPDGAASRPDDAGPGRAGPGAGAEEARPGDRRHGHRPWLSGSPPATGRIRCRPASTAGSGASACWSATAASARRCSASTS